MPVEDERQHFFQPKFWQYGFASPDLPDHPLLPIHLDKYQNRYIFPITHKSVLPAQPALFSGFPALP